MAEEGRSTGERPVFVTTNLDTRLAVAVSDDDTVGRLKQKVVDEHLVCFPKIGGIKLISMKVRRKSGLYHLTDSMLVKSAFYGLKGFWSLNVDADVISSLKEDTSMILGRSKATNGHPDKSLPTLGQDHILGPQSRSYPLESYPTCNVQDVSLDNLNTSLEKGKEIPDEHVQNLIESGSQGAIKHGVYDVTNDAVEVTSPNLDYSKDSNVRAEVVETGSDFNGDNNTACKRGRPIKRAENENSASQKRQKKKAPSDMTHANLPLENQISTSLPVYNIIKPLKGSSAEKLSTNRLPEEVVPEGTGIEKNRRKRKSSNPESKLDPGLLSENNSQTLKGNLEMSLASQVGISVDSVQSSERELVQSKLDNIIDSLLESSDKGLDCNGENAANSLIESSEPLEGDVSTKELVPKEGAINGTVSGEPRTKEVRSRKESTVKETSMQTKSRIASAKKVVNKSIILEAKSKEKCHGKGNVGGKNVKIVDEETKGSVPLATSDDVLKNIQKGNAPLETSESAEIRMDKFEEVPKSKRRSLENREGKAVANGNTELFANGVPEFESQYKESPNVESLVQINGEKGGSNMINSSKIFHEGTQGETTSHSLQSQVQNEHEDLNVLENSKNLENVVQIKKRKSSKSRKLLLGTEFNKKPEHDKSLEAEACHQRDQDGEAIVNEASCKQQNSSDELIVPVKQIEENAGREKHADQTGEVKTRDENSAYDILEQHEDAASEALSNKCRTKSKAKKTARTTKDAVNQKLDGVENLENIHSTDLRVDDGQTDTVNIRAHHFTNDEKEVKRKSKKTEALVTEKIVGGLLNPMDKNHSVLDMKDGLVKKPKRKPNKAKGYLTLVDSEMTSEKDGCPRPDVPGHNDKESVSGKIDKSPLLDILLPKAAQASEPEAGPVMKESHGRALVKQNADDQLENFGSKPTENFPVKEPIQQSKRPSKKTPATGGRESNRTVANKQKTSRAKACSRDDSSHNTENLEGTVYTSNQGAITPAHASPYLLAGRKPRDKGFGTVNNQSNQKKRALAESDSIFESTDSESSHDFRKGNKSESDTKSPDDSSGYSEDTPTSRKLPNVNSPQIGSVRTVAHDGKRTIRGDNCLSQASSGRKSLDAVLRNSRSYKKAKIIASQSMLDPAESETI